MADRHAEKLRTLRHLSDLAGELPDGALDRRLRISVSEQALATEAGQVLVLTVARLAPRFCDRIVFDSPDGECIPRLRPLLGAEVFSTETLIALAEMIWSEGTFEAATEVDVNVDVTLGVGTAGDVSIGIDDAGVAVMSRTKPMTVEAADACFAALTAASVGCIEAAKMLLPGILPESRVEELHLAMGPLGGRLDARQIFVLDRPHLVGVGAVGCALVYALICVGATGRVVLLDPDHVSDSNLMRYVLFDERHLKRKKVTAARSLVAASGLDLAVEPADVALADYLEARPEERERLELVISAVDSYDARREIAALIPREVLNAGTTPGDFTISRHRLADGRPCLACLYPAAGLDVERAAVMGRELGLPKADVAEMLRRKTPLTREVISKVERHLELTSGELEVYVGEPLDTLHNKEVCAKVSIQTARGEAVAPLAFGSALAGFFLAHGLAGASLGETRRYFRVDFLRGLETPRMEGPAPRRECAVCGSDAYVLTYLERWGTPEVRRGVAGTGMGHGAQVDRQD